MLFRSCFVFEVCGYYQEGCRNLRRALSRLSFLADASELSDLEDGDLRFLRRALDELVEFVLGSDVVDGLRPDFCVVARGVSEKRTPRAARGGSGVRGAYERTSHERTVHMCE